MNNFKTIAPEEITSNPFKLIGKDWALLTADKPDGKTNMMTVSWGGMGVLWGKPVAFIFVRPTRYTREFIEQTGRFSLSFFPEEQREALTLCGAKSGRDIDKISATKLHKRGFGGVSAFDEATLVLSCKNLYKDRIDPVGFLDDTIEKNYAEQDYHYLYVGEIEGVYTR